MFVRIAVEQNGRALEWASAELQSNSELVIAAVLQDPSAIQFATFDFALFREVLLNVAESVRDRVCLEMMHPLWSSSPGTNSDYSRYLQLFVEIDKVDCIFVVLREHPELLQVAA